MLLKSGLVPIHFAGNDGNLEKHLVWVVVLLCFFLTISTEVLFFIYMELLAPALFN